MGNLQCTVVDDGERPQEEIVVKDYRYSITKKSGDIYTEFDADTRSNETETPSSSSEPSSREHTPTVSATSASKNEYATSSNKEESGTSPNKEERGAEAEYEMDEEKDYGRSSLFSTDDILSALGTCSVSSGSYEMQQAETQKERDEPKVDAEFEQATKKLSEILKEEEKVIGLDADTREAFELGIKNTVEFPENWAVGLESNRAKIVYDYKPGDSFVWTHSVFQCKNVTIDEVLAGTGELSEWPTWHPTATKTEYKGPRTATSYGSRVDNSIAFGLLKFDANTKLNRFIGPGYVLEVLLDAHEGDAAYVPPTKGYKRSGFEAYTMFVPTPSGVMFIMRAKADLFLSLPSWIIGWVMKSFAPKTMSNFQSLMDLVKSDKKKFKELMRIDETGVYAILRKTQKEAEKDYLVTDWRDHSRLKRMFSEYISPSSPEAKNDLTPIPVKQSSFSSMFSLSRKSKGSFRF